MEQLITDYIAYLEAHPDEAIQNIVYTVNTGRAAFRYQARFKAESHESLLAHLKSNTQTDEELKTPTQGIKLNLPTYPF